MAFIEKKPNDNGNLCKIHVGFYIASALITIITHNRISAEAM